MVKRLFWGGFGFRFRPQKVQSGFGFQKFWVDSNSKQLDSGSDSRKMRRIRIDVNLDSGLLDSDPDSRCPDLHITDMNQYYNQMSLYYLDHLQQ